MNTTHTILTPRITEKATFSSEQNVYVFEIHQDANKTDVANAVKEFYKVTPVAVNITRNPAKKTFRGGKRGKTAAIKKAYVYLAKGDKIEII